MPKPLRTRRAFLLVGECLVLLALASCGKTASEVSAGGGAGHDDRAAASGRPVAVQPFSAEERLEVEAAHEAYGAAWLANDRSAVLATLTEDVVLMPSGMTPIEGHAAAEAFWWPDDGSTTTLTAYESTIEDVRGSGGVAVVRARSSMTFIWQKEGEASVQTNGSMSLSVLERGDDGRWRITVRMWGRRAE